MKILVQQLTTFCPIETRMSRRHHLQTLKQAAPAIAPSLLMCDFGNLQQEVSRLEAAGAPLLHLDVMDGSFVPNLSYGMPIVAACRKLSKLPLDVHLMIQKPGDYIDAFYEAGADIITIHVESVDNPRPILEKIASLGCGAGLALNPATPLEKVLPHLDLCDLALVMSVNAGFGGQKFNPIALEKLSSLRKAAPANCLLEVDGGVNTSTIASCADAGAEVFVVGSAIFGQEDYGNAIAGLSEATKTSTGG